MTGLLSLLVSFTGLGCFAMAMPQHWRQWCGDRPCRPAVVLLLRLSGSMLLLGALFLCISSVHPTIGVLVWVMLLALGAVLLALLLARRKSAI